MRPGVQQVGGALGPDMRMGARPTLSDNSHAQQAKPSTGYSRCRSGTRLRQKSDVRIDHITEQEDRIAENVRRTDRLDHVSFLP